MMIRVLFRKEIRELLSFYMYDRKKKQKRSKAALIGYLCLYGFVFISVAVSFFGIATLLFQSNTGVTFWDKNKNYLAFHQM